MAVTDLTDALPWWARQGAGPTGGPAAAPMGSGGPPGANGTGWLQYLAQMFGPNAAQAGENDPIATLRAGGSPVPSTLANGGPPVPPIVASQQPPPFSTTMPPSPFSTGSFSGGPQPPMPYAATGPIGPGLPGPVGVTPGGIGGWSSPAQGGGPVGAPGGPVPPGADIAAPNAQPVSATRRLPGPLATGGATAQGATSNPRFGTFQYQDPNSVGTRAPIYTALNLGGLFGGGQPAAAAPAAANPANLPTRNATPVSGPLARGGLSKAPWTYGPQQRNIGWPSNTPYGPDWRDLAASRSGYQ